MGKGKNKKGLRSQPRKGGRQQKIGSQRGSVPSHRDTITRDAGSIGNNASATSSTNYFELFEEVKAIKSEVLLNNRLILQTLEENSSSVDLQKAKDKIKELETELKTKTALHKGQERVIGNLQEDIKQQKKELATLGKSNTKINNILESSVNDISQNKTELVEKIIDNCSKKINNSFYVLFLLERLGEAKKLEKKYPGQSSKVFMTDFEGDIAQLISVNICAAKINEKLDLDEIDELIQYVNEKLDKWEIVPMKGSEYFIKENHESIGKTEANSRIREYWTLPIKIKTHAIEHTEPKKALVDAR